jgi:hypothetical protein
MTLGRSVAQATAKRGRELGAESALTTLRKLHPYQPPKVDTAPHYARHDRFLYRLNQRAP